jgi:hypothetical protein
LRAAFTAHVILLDLIILIIFAHTYPSIHPHPHTRARAHTRTYPSIHPSTNTHTSTQSPTYIHTYIGPRARTHPSTHTYIGARGRARTHARARTHTWSVHKWSSYTCYKPTHVLLLSTAQYNRHRFQFGPQTVKLVQTQAVFFWPSLWFV